MQHAEQAGARPPPVPLLPCPALAGKFFKSLKDGLFSRGQVLPMLLRVGRKQDKERRKRLEGFWVVGRRKQTTWVQIKLKFPQLFAPITRENKNISGALGIFAN